jgi:hypothetical protein
MAQKITVHTRKFYRVVLEGIDAKVASTESFSIKLSLRMRTPLPRVRQVLRKLPCTIKRGLEADQANRLKAVLESIGGRVHLESYFVTPGQEEPCDGHLQIVPEEPDVVVTQVCPSCGREDEAGAKHCSFCLETEDPKASGNVPDDAEPTVEDVPEDVPADVENPRPSVPPVAAPPAVAPGIGATLWANRLLFAAGVLMILLLIAIVKQ